MAESLVGGLCRAGTDPSTITVSDPSKTRCELLQRRFGVVTTTDNGAAAGAGTCILAVKPQVMRPVLEGLVDTVRASRPLLVSIAAGIPLFCLDRWAGGGNAVVRAMPNTPALVGCGASVLVSNDLVTDEQRRFAERILATAGSTDWVEDEGLMDVVTALSGSGPAYFFYFMEALAAAAARRGLDPGLARRLCTQTGRGAATLAQASDDLTLEKLRENVTSPGGTTERGIASLVDDNVAEALERALDAAMKRSAELAKILGDIE